MSEISPDNPFKQPKNQNFWNNPGFKDFMKRGWNGVLGAADIVTMNAFDLDSEGTGGWAWQWDHNKKVREALQEGYEKLSEEDKKKVKVLVENDNSSTTTTSTKPWKNPWEKNLIRDGRRGPSQRMPSDLRYPYSTIDNTQDFLKFSVFEYKRSVRTALQLSKRNQTSFISSGNESLSQEQGNLRDTRDLLGSVILPIPAQLADTNSTAWGESRMNDLESKLYEGSIGAVQGNAEKVRESFQGILGSLSANQNMVQSYFAKQAVNSLIGGNITLDQLLARNQGEILNPNLELLFSGPTLRNFTFNFKLTPRYEKEAQIIRTIIKSFKRNMAPKGSGGTVLRTPNVFQIEYMGRAKDYLNRMKICALKNVAVNYTGDGTFATYKDGAPISSMLTLSFTELTPIYNEDYAGYDNNEDGVGF
tara:strand:- start:1049 stop:2305 length:1257 start_codon:yes stop_codon:yes gene_type:complete